MLYTKPSKFADRINELSQVRILYSVPKTEQKREKRPIQSHQINIQAWN